jgi:hypothetical protein
MKRISLFQIRILKQRKLIKRMGEIDEKKEWKQSKKEKRLFQKLRDKGSKKFTTILKTQKLQDKRCYYCPYQFDTHTMNCIECCPIERVREAIEMKSD